MTRFLLTSKNKHKDLTGENQGLQKRVIHINMPKFILGKIRNTMSRKHIRNVYVEKGSE